MGWCAAGAAPPVTVVIGLLRRRAAPLVTVAGGLVLAPNLLAPLLPGVRAAAARGLVRPHLQRRVPKIATCKSTKVGVEFSETKKKQKELKEGAMPSD